MKYLIANWKANKNLIETKQWFETFSKNYQAKENITVIIAPPFPFLNVVVDKTEALKNVQVAAQDLSEFEEGSYTGEVTAKSLRGLVDYVILGHSEKRRHFNETDEIIAKKIELAHKYQIKTILCLRGTTDKLVEGIEMVAYEPVEAIGTGDNAPLENVLQLKRSLVLAHSVKFLYGGSVTDQNVSQYLHSDQIDGLLIGGASLDPERFSRIISQV